MAQRTHFESVDEYMAALPEPTRSVLERVRATVRKALPGAVEALSYQMPVYKLDGVMVLYIAGYRRHWSIYPASPHVLAVLGDEVAGLLHSKATLRFPLDKVPVRLIARIARLRAEEATERGAARERRKELRKAMPARRAKRR